MYDFVHCEQSSGIVEIRYDGRRRITDYEVLCRNLEVVILAFHEIRSISKGQICILSSALISRVSASHFISGMLSWIKASLFGQPRYPPDLHRLSTFRLCPPCIGFLPLLKRIAGEFMRQR